ncbi:hypothetical protein DZF91_13865 [Actinomadura logoneensis]|uniref:Uncharacterized protein n=1 Tax=Actinomadura logoneensis TaxID=2293572 RepID=A0A372JMP7_9ACTN|nr:DUF6461 domain-containing protein [Actinomadura logoneensis]RFU41054.1 hypothetical protein DZF91_13865 [Actinomadura logoneensis]
MDATAEDYAWVRNETLRLTDAYCLTLTRGLSPDEVLTRWTARPHSVRRGYEELIEPAYEVAGRDLSDVLVGVTPVKDGDGGDWALAVEINGYLGSSTAVALSRGTRVVSHFRNVNAVGRFHLAEDGVEKAVFDPLFPAMRFGAMSAAVRREMRAAGFDLGKGDDRDLSVTLPAAFALAERLTGVRLTLGLLTNAEYLCGVARLP